MINEPFQIKDTYEECDYLYGGEDYIITAKDLLALASGKILNADVNWEYGITLKLADDAIPALIDALEVEEYITE